MGKEKTLPHRIKYTKRRRQVMKLVGDISVIKAILSKSREKLETAQIDFDNERYNDSVSRSYYAFFNTWPDDRRFQQGIYKNEVIPCCFYQDDKEII